jgi:hypothetical protein
MRDGDDLAPGAADAQAAADAWETIDAWGTTNARGSTTTGRDARGDQRPGAARSLECRVAEHLPDISGSSLNSRLQNVN